MTRSANYTQSPFPVSGRGNAPARPNWASMDLEVADAAAPITRTQPMQPVNGSVVNLSSERARRAAKVVGATG